MAFAATMCTYVHLSMLMCMFVIVLCNISMMMMLCMSMWSLFLWKQGLQFRIIECTRVQSWTQIIHFIFAKNKRFWVPQHKANPRGPNKKTWVPKPPPFAFDVGEGSHKTWEDWCLGSGCIWTWWTYFWDASLSREFWWKGHHNWSFGVGNNF